MTGVVTRRALFETIHERPKTELENGWDRLSKILDYLVNVLPTHAAVHSTEDLNSTNVLIPLIVYLFLQKGHFPNDKTLKHAIHWLYAAHVWSRYTAQTDQRLEYDLSIVVREETPWERLCAQIIDQRGRIEVKPGDLDGRGVQHPLYRMLFILSKAHGAIDWFNGTPLGVTHGNTYKIHSHHIFPQSILYKNIYSSESHVGVKRVNEIANRAFLTADTNLTISAKLPEIYLPEIEQNYPGALVKQFIPLEPQLWKVENYEDFLAARREIVARKTNEFMNGLISEPEETRERPITELIALGESSNLEFKSTLQWDVIQNQHNKNLRHSVLKTIAAFLNTEGGTLLIGVEDSGAIFGLEADLKLLGHSLDKFMQLMSSLICETLGPEYSHLIKLRTENIEGKVVCIIDVDRAPEPVFLKGSKGKEFYIRVGNTSRALDSSETVNFVGMNWNVG